MYNLKDHGDKLEKLYHEFITEQISTYENVWRTYIGNRGNDTRAIITNYPKDREEKRISFSEHTYTVLQSVILLKRLIESKSFELTGVPPLDDQLKLQNDILLFFTHIGRINDNLLAASSCLLGSSFSKIEKSFAILYHKRHIPVHGRVLPIIYIPDSVPQIPTFSVSTTDKLGWYHKTNNWPDVFDLPKQSVNEATTKLYWELLSLVKEAFGLFEKSINEELTNGDFKLQFEYNCKEPNPLITCTSIYGIDLNLNPEGSASFASSSDPRHKR